MKHTLLVCSLLGAAAVVATTTSVSAQSQSALPRAVAAAQPSARAEGDTRPKPAAPESMAEYRLGPGDKLRIEVYKDAQLSQSLQIRPDGKITLPLVGDVAAAGRTPMELRDAIGAALKDFITNPVVTVIVTEATPPPVPVVYVTGEVNKPGALSLTIGPMSVLQALAMAGGLTDFADRKDIRILRKGEKGMETLKFNYKDALKDNNTREPLLLQAGDTVIVK